MFKIKTILKTLHGKEPHTAVGTLINDLNRGYLARREFVRLACLLGVTATSASAFAGFPSLARSQENATPKKGGTLRFGMVVQQLDDPALSNWVEASCVYRHVVEYLTETGIDNITRPYLAQSWEPNEDLTLWTFRLRPNVTWSNGDAFTTEDVKANFDRWTSPESKSIARTILGSLTRFEVVDSLTFRLHFSSPYLTIAEDLYQYPLPITHRDYARKGGNWLDNPIGTGPYTITQYEVGSKAALERRDGYWGDPVYLDKVQFIDLGELSQAYIAALASKQIDLLYRIGQSDLDMASRLPGTKIYKVSTTSTPALRFKVNNAPFNNPDIRKALRLCVDRKKMVEVVMNGFAETAEDHHTAPVHPEYFALPVVAKDVEAARALMLKAGYTKDKPLKIELAVGNTQGIYEQNIATFFKNEAAEIGVDVDVKVMPQAQYWPIWDKVDFGLTFWAHRPLAVSVHRLAYQTGAQWNETGFSDPAYDAALDVASGIVDAQKRSLAMQKVESILQDASVMVQPIWVSLMTLGSERVNGFDIHPTLYHRFNKIWLS